MPRTVGSAKRLRKLSGKSARRVRLPSEPDRQRFGDSSYSWPSESDWRGCSRRMRCNSNSNNRLQRQLQLLHLQLHPCQWPRLQARQLQQLPRLGLEFLLALP